MTLDAEDVPVNPGGRPEAIVIGVSAGALDVLSIILPQLPADYGLPVIVVVHIPPDRPSMMADLLAKKCVIDVREAEDKESIRPGTAYFAPPDYHLLVERDRTFALSSEEPVHFSRPSIDVLFESAADAYGPRVWGVILTGASDDGALGLRSILAAGGQGLIQRPDQAYYSVMPEAARTACPAARVLTVEEIVTCLRQVSLVE